MIGCSAHDRASDPSRTSARGSCGRHRRSPLRPRSTHTPAMPSVRLAAGPACLRRVSPRAHTIPHTTAHTGTCSGAHTCARLPMSTCATSHTHTAPLSHALGLTHLCAHAHMQRRAYMRELADVYMRRIRTQHLSLSVSHTCAHTHTCAHAHAHSQTDRFTHTDGISQERNT